MTAPTATQPPRRRTTPRGPAPQDAPRALTRTAVLGRPQLVLRAGPLSVRVPRRTAVTVTALAVVALALVVLSLGTGSYTLSPGQVVSALLGHQDGIVRTIVVDWRLPRVLVAALFGAALGLGGAIFQSMTRNPLGSPDIIGFDTGAYTGALLVLLVWHTPGLYATTAAALVGGLATAAVVYLLAYRRGVQGFRLIVVGIGITAMLGSFDTWLLLSATTQDAVRASYWGAGSLDAVGYEQLWPAVAAFAVLFPAAAVLSRPLGALALGDDAGRQLGTRVEGARLALVVVGVALSATVTALAGPIAFVALVSPQVARRLAGSAGIGLGASAATGCVLLLAADWVAQHALPTTLPVGVVTVVIGGGYFVWLLVMEGRRR